MGDLLDFEKAYRERMVSKLMNQLGTMYQQANGVANDYYQLILKNPEEAIQRLPEFIERARDINPVRAYEAMAGGPNHDWTGPMLDILGIVYPELEKDAREKGLRQCMNFLDGLNSFYSQNHVELINDPWLASDIVITRPLYWCGYKQYCDLAEQNKSWKDFSEKMNSARSAFWLAMAITHPEYASLEVRKNFHETFPTLMDRTKDAIAAMVAVYGGRKAEREGLELADCIEERLAKHDPMLYDNIRAKIEEKKWILLK